MLCHLMRVRRSPVESFTSAMASFSCSPRWLSSAPTFSARSYSRSRSLHGAKQGVAIAPQRFEQQARSHGTKRGATAACPAPGLLQRNGAEPSQPAACHGRQQRAAIRASSSCRQCPSASALVPCYPCSAPPGVVIQQGPLLSVQPLRLAFHAHQRIVDALLVRLQHLQGEAGGRWGRSPLRHPGTEPESPCLARGVPALLRRLRTLIAAQAGVQTELFKQAVKKGLPV